MNKLVTGLFSILLLIPMLLSAQTYTRYTSSNSNLPHNQIYCIDFDNNDNIWFGGQKNPGSGIANVSMLSSDLSTWTVYNQNDLALPEDRVFFMACDNSNNMWFCTHYGFSVLRNTGVAELIAWTDGDYSRTVETDSQGNVYLSDRDSAAIFVSPDEGANWTKWTAADIGMSSGRPEIYDLREDSQGQLWLCTYYGVFYRDLSNVWHAIPAPVEGAYTYGMAMDLNDHMWVADFGTLDLYEILPDETVNVYNSTNYSFLANAVNDLECDVNGHLWLATDGAGLIELMPGGTFNQYDSLTTSGQIAQNNITHMEIHNDVIWLSTADSGIVSISGMIVNSIGDEIEQTPLTFNLKQNYPNPFNPSTNIEFSIEKTGNVLITIYNTNGQLIKTLTDQNYVSGSHKVSWNGMDNNNQKVSSGVYLYSLHSEDKVTSNKMILMK